MKDFNEPKFDELLVGLYLTKGQTKTLISSGIRKMERVVLSTPYQGQGYISFYAKDLTEIVTRVKEYGESDEITTNLKGIKGNTTRTIKALEQAVIRNWQGAQNAYKQDLEQLRKDATSELPIYQVSLEKGQYGFILLARQENRLINSMSVTVAPVTFVSLDGTPTVEWVADQKGFFLSITGGNEREKNPNRFGDLETAIEYAKVLLATQIDDEIERCKKYQIECQIKLAELKIA